MTFEIWCGSEFGWVRTWQYLERRWFTFSIRHALTVRVTELQNFKMIITPTLGFNDLGAVARADKNEEAFLPPLQFGQKRYFGEVWPFIEPEKTRLLNFIRQLIWSGVAEYIPCSPLEGVFNTPQVVSEVRHQDAIIDHVQNIILNTGIPTDSETHYELPDVPLTSRTRLTSRSKTGKDDKEKLKKSNPPNKFELILSGDTVLAGAGRVVAFESCGSRPDDLGEVVVLLSSINLPARDDLPVIFVNIDTLFDVPLEAMTKLRIISLYTRWILKDNVHDSERRLLNKGMDQHLTCGSINFNDHHAVPLPPELVTEITSTFLEEPYKIQLRGTKYPSAITKKPQFFGYAPNDREISTSVPTSFEFTEELDFLIATTNIDAKQLARGYNTVVRGEYSLNPLTVSVVELNRQRFCTNDINAIRASVRPNIVVPAHVILEAHMTLEVSIGIVGCKPCRPINCFSRLYAILHNVNDAMALVTKITQINEETTVIRSNELLTGFAVDTGSACLLYVEGLRDGNILIIWQMTEDFYPRVKPLYSSSARYFSRIYADLIEIAIPFVVLKMHANMGVILACPSVYVRPALPLPARSALLKINRILAGRLLHQPPRSLMPTSNELNSFRLEMCTPPRPTIVKKQQLLKSDEIGKNPRTSLSRINWEKN
ncbi:uncharacterized protein LOC113229440 isoform X2 [Hyposmocoma kahamanoa]|uniref:uncharacterized protein LOC113229440 isoform X2 n=1 Tax=Hyposmocoma kahamanoa TaxID=1477025 RepID=UPI000E6D8001|nr:uncharacterized protein LOC113229440 isoform X2 [Hyposmocoma kahamanoa]